MPVPERWRFDRLFDHAMSFLPCCRRLVVVLGREEVDQGLAAEGKAAPVHAERILDEAGLTYSSHIEIGRPSHGIATFARENACDQIVMGTHGKGTPRTMVVGSVAMRVVALADVPVTVVK
jgi:nucleotide-binding universal stress UspA family protein